MSTPKGWRESDESHRNNQQREAEMRKDIERAQQGQEGETKKSGCMLILIPTIITAAVAVGAVIKLIA